MQAVGGVPVMSLLTPNDVLGVLGGTLQLASFKTRVESAPGVCA
jgi:hypothetical protein